MTRGRVTRDTILNRFRILNGLDGISSWGPGLQKLQTLKKSELIEIVTNILSNAEIYQRMIDDYIDDEIEARYKREVTAANKYREKYMDEHIKLNQIREELDSLKEKHAQKRKYSNETRQEIKQAHKAGQSIRELAKHYQMSPTTVQKILKE